MANMSKKTKLYSRFLLLRIYQFMYCIVLFWQLLYILVMGVVPSLISNVCVCMYVVDSPKRQGEAMNTGRQSPSSFRQVSWFILRADRDTGPTA